MSEYQNGFNQDEIYVDPVSVEDAASSSDNRYNSSYIPNEPKRKNKKKGGKVKRFFAIVLSAVLFGTVAGGTMIGVNSLKDYLLPSSTSKVEVTTPSTEDDNDDKNTAEASQTTQITSTDVTSVVEQVMPAVVSITCTVQTTNFYYGTQESQGAGSGFIIANNKDKLYIATNNHVVSDATSLTVAFCDGTTANAQVVGTDKDADLAVISVEATEISDETSKEIKVAVLGDSDSLKVGQSVIAIGNALGYGQSVTTGVISAKDREVSFTDGTMTLLQTDAAINPGNSGGVLINAKGEVIGINNAKLSDESVEGMGYAIPMTTAKTILEELMNATTVKEGDQAFLGVVGKTIDQTYSEALGMPSGIYVSQVVSGSPAEKAGINAGDIITKYEGNDISTMDGLKEKLARKAAGDKVKITVQRADQNGTYEEQTIEVTLGKKSDFADSTSEENNSQQNQQNQQNQQDQQQQQNPYGNNGQGQQDGNDYYNNDGNSMSPYDFFFGNNW